MIPRLEGGQSSRTLKGRIVTSPVAAAALSLVMMAGVLHSLLVRHSVTCAARYLARQHSDWSADPAQAEPVLPGAYSLIYAGLDVGRELLGRQKLQRARAMPITRGGVWPRLSRARPDVHPTTL